MSEKRVSSSATAVVRELPSSGFAPDNQSVATRLRDLADRIAEGAYGGVDAVLLVIEHNGELDRETYGAPIDRARAVGLLTMAVVRAVVDVDE